MKYRSDVDGLRAIAVLSVILSHAGLPGFTGGAIGVDVFFVISGFLITSIITQEMSAEKWSLIGFYERRARRILPALLLVILTISPLSWYLMLPDYLQNYGQSVTATLLFSNNILLALTGGYWELDSSFKPLLHTWSLGVEEQFYIVFPLILLMIWRFGRRVQLVAIFSLGLVSLFFAEWGWRHFPDENFYLPIGRAWELMVGCAAAYAQRTVRPWHGFCALLGLATIVLTVGLYSEQTPSPSLWIVPPVLGTALVLVCSHPSSGCWKILSLRPLVWVGLISYSAYLWHQPLFALARIALLEPPPIGVMLALTALSLGLAWLSWRFVEQPFRSSTTVSRRVLVLSTASLSLALVGAGIFLHISQGLPKRIFPNIESVAAVHISYNERIWGLSGDGFASAAHPRVMVVGNSFARDIANTLLEIGLPTQKSLVYAPVGPDDFLAGSISAKTAGLLQQADLIIMAIERGKADSIVRAVDILQGMTPGRVIVFGTKNFGANINPFIRVPMDQRGGVRSAAVQEFVVLNEDLRGRLPQGQYIDIMSLFGEDGRHLAVFDENGNPLTPDRAHLTRYGAVALARKLRERHPDFVTLLQ